MLIFIAVSGKILCDYSRYHSCPHYYIIDEMVLFYLFITGTLSNKLSSKLLLIRLGTKRSTILLMWCVIHFYIYLQAFCTCFHWL